MKGPFVEVHPPLFNAFTLWLQAVQLELHGTTAKKRLRNYRKSFNLSFVSNIWFINAFLVPFALFKFQGLQPKPSSFTFSVIPMCPGVITYPKTLLILANLYDPEVEGVRYEGDIQTR